jgi:hypothetical protein
VTRLTGFRLSGFGRAHYLGNHNNNNNNSNNNHINHHPTLI